MKKQSLYRELAPYYDLIYSWKDYRREADKLNRLVAGYKKSEGKNLLEVACGTGSHLLYLRQNFSCTGTDINEAMLPIAKKKVKGAAFKKADMVNMRLNRKFDVIACLFSSIGYVKTHAKLQKTLKTFAAHLKIGGVAIIEPWFTKASYKAGFAHMTTYDGKDLKIARLAVSKVKGKVSVMDMHYLIAEGAKGVRHLVDRHELGLFETEKTLQFMEQAGFKAKFLRHGLMKGRGLFIGIKE